MIKSNQGKFSFSPQDFKKSIPNNRNSGVGNKTIPNFNNSVFGTDIFCSVPISFDIGAHVKSQGMFIDAVFN